MGGLVFNESTMLDGNIFKFEKRLQSHANKYVENGTILTTYFSQKESAITVDRGTRDINQIFGNESPLRFNLLEDFPLYGFGQTNPNNTDEQQIEDFNVEGDCIIIPNTIVPKPMDFFMINHLKMKALFQITDVSFDSMKEEGFYKIHYRLYSTEEDSIQGIHKLVVENYHTDLNAVGSDVNPIIKKDDYAKKVQIIKMVNKMIESYRALFYNERHNCFLFHHPDLGLDFFDMCGNEFIAKHSLMNIENDSKVIILHDKLKEKQFPLYYNNSIYNWIELGCPSKMIQKFYFILVYASNYPTSSFAAWSDDSVQVMIPLATYQAGINVQNFSYFDNQQMMSFLNKDLMPISSEYDKLIWKYIHKPNDLSLNDISLNIADTLLSSIRHIDVFLYTPIIIYIIRQILDMN